MVGSCLPFAVFANQPAHLARLGMPFGLQFGVQQFAVDADLKAPTIGGNKREAGDIGFKFLQQFGRQTDSPRGVASGNTVHDFDVHFHGNLQ